MTVWCTHVKLPFSVLLLQSESDWFSFSASANENKSPNHNLRKTVFCNPVYKATGQWCLKQSQPFLWCWMLLLSRLESQLGREAAKLSILQLSHSQLLKRALLWTLDSVCFFLLLSFPLPSLNYYDSPFALSEKVLFSFVAHRTEEALYMMFCPRHSLHPSHLI